MTAKDVLKVTDTEGRPVKFIYECFSGVIFYVTPISLATLRAIQLKAMAFFPYPDKEPYEVLEDPETSFDPNQKLPAEVNPEYQALCRVVDKERKNWADRAIFNYTVECPKYPTHEALVTAFKPQLDKLRKIAELPEDDYEAVLFHLVFTWNQVALNEKQQYTPAGNEYGRIIDLAIQTVALSEEEVIAGIRYFRPRIQRSAH